MQGALMNDESRTDAIGIAVVVTTIIVSALCYAFILHAGIALAE
jgi:hypothetical protein